MTAVFVCDHFRPFEIGGAERSAERLATALVARGHRVLVAALNFGAAAREHVGGVEIVRLPFPQRLSPGQLPRRVWLTNPMLHWIYGRRLATLIRRVSADVVHVQNSALITAAIQAGRATAVPVVVTVRDLAYLDVSTFPPPRSDASRLFTAKWYVDTWWARLDRMRKRRALAAAAGIVFVSDALRCEYARRGGETFARRGRVVYNIPPALEAAPPSARSSARVLFVGKLSEGKGLRVLYASAARVLAALPTARFVVAGAPGVGFVPPPPDVAHAFELTGALPAADVHALMRTASVLAAPSVWPEPFSRVLLEAMSLATPIVASSAGGNVEALEDRRSALLVPPADDRALADAMVEVLTDPDLAARLGAGARERVETRFSEAGVVADLFAAYRHASARV
jgi:glycosyltransferase involved in cell wall biosynthesis